MRENCPNCGAKGMSPFYEVHEIPAHSCLLMDDSETARSYPRRDLVLAFCDACGFISNVVFDPHVHEYSAGYEEQQSFSPRFRAFQTELVQRLVAQYGVRGKDVVEIGCGKGDFLVELCEAGGNRGVGIDPACDAERVGAVGSQRVRFIPELYSAAHAGLPCDFLCCRHTLEHIHETNAFVAEMRRVVGDRPGTLVFFEVPDVERILRERAFWDIYYEHCSYFSLGSLARLFRANRFELLELVKDYDDQYLLIIAQPADEPTKSQLAAEDDLKQLARGVGDFREAVREEVAGWRAKFAELRATGRTAAIWGSGSKCVSFLGTVEPGAELAAIVDVNRFRHGKHLPGYGHRIASPEALKTCRPDLVVVMNPIYRAEIRKQLDEMGLAPELTCVGTVGKEPAVVG